jgi:hypothetical protein
MEYIEYEISQTKGKQPRNRCRFALLSTSGAVLALADKITKKLNSAANIDTFVDKCINGGKPQPWKELCELADAVKDIKAMLLEAKAAEEKHTARQAKVSAAAGAVATATAAATATLAPIVNVVVNNYTGAAAAVSTHMGDTGAATVGRKGNRAGNSPGQSSGKMKIGKSIREEIWEKYIGDKAKADCPVCLKRPIRMTDFSAGHIEAESRGGATDATNLIPICSNCNCRMSTENLYAYTRKNFGRDPVFPALTCETALVPSSSEPKNVILSEKDSRRKCSKVIKHDHCRAISGTEIEKKPFDSDEEAIAFAKECGYTGITHKTGSKAVYYFVSKSPNKFKIAEDSKSGAWEYTSWELIY